MRSTTERLTISQVAIRVVIGLSLINVASMSSARADEGPVSVCGPAPLFLSVVSNLVPTNPSLQDLRNVAATSVSISRSGSAFHVRRTDSLRSADVSAALADASSASTGPCRGIRPNDSRLVDAQSVPGIDIAALAAVVRYNNGGFRWPAGAVDRNTAASEVVVSTFGPFAYVLIRGDSPSGSLRCAPTETYRIDPSTFEVLPYQERCLDADGKPQLLPKLRDLPKTPGRPIGSGS